MGSQINASARGAQTLALLSALTSDPEVGSQRLELHRAKVAQHTIDSLYPFDLRDHLSMIREILNERKSFLATAPILRNVHVAAALATLPAEARVLAEEVNLMTRQITQGITFQRSSAHPDFSSAQAACAWADLLRYFHACSHAGKMYRGHIGVANMLHQIQRAEELAAKVQQLRAQG